MSTSTGIIDWAENQSERTRCVTAFLRGITLVGSKISRTAYQMLLIHALIQI